MRITVIAADGASHAVDVRPGATAAAVLAALRANPGTSLLHNRRVLSPGETLGECGVTEGEVLHLRPADLGHSDEPTGPEAAPQLLDCTPAAAACDVAPADEAAEPAIAQRAAGIPAEPPAAAAAASAAPAGVAADLSSTSLVAVPLAQSPTASSVASTSSTSSAGAPMRTARAKATACALLDCNSRAVAIVGQCRYCSLKFCARHRLPETHTCSGMQSVKKASFDRLAGRLLGERCVAPKVVGS